MTKINIKIEHTGDHLDSRGKIKDQVERSSEYLIDLCNVFSFSSHIHPDITLDTKYLVKIQSFEKDSLTFSPSKSYDPKSLGPFLNSINHLRFIELPHSNIDDFHRYINVTYLEDVSFHERQSRNYSVRYRDYDTFYEVECLFKKDNSNPEKDPIIKEMTYRVGGPKDWRSFYTEVFSGVKDFEECLKDIS